MNIPKYLQPVTSVTEVEAETVQLAINGNSHFEVYFIGKIEVIDGTTYIVADLDKSEMAYSQIFIKEKNGDKMYVVYDGRIHGYNNMFCDEHKASDAIPQLLEHNGSSVFSVTVTLGYGIEYDDEKEDYDVDANDMAEVMNREERISWQQVKEEGYDWLTIQMENEKGESVFVDEELA